jgi:hypothetical protein
VTGVRKATSGITKSEKHLDKTYFTYKEGNKKTMMEHSGLVSKMW